MVLKGIKVSNIDNVTVIELGEGDVAIGSIILPEEKSTGIAFNNIDKIPVGTIIHDEGKTTNDTGVDVILTFSNLESLEVLEEKLANAKKALIEMLDKENKCKRGFDDPGHYCLGCGDEMKCKRL